MKTKIEDAITVIADLRTDLDSLLKSADDSAEDNSEDDLQGSLDADESLYAMGNYNLSKALRKIKKPKNKENSNE